MPYYRPESAPGPNQETEETKNEQKNESFYDQYPGPYEKGTPVTDVSGLNEEQKKEFKERFVNRSLETIQGEKLEYVHLGPENQREEISTVYLKGFAANNLSYRDYLNRLADHKTAVFAIDNPHGINSGLIAETKKQIAGQKMGELPDIELRKAAAVQEMANREEIKLANLVLHSEAAIYGTIFALMNPDKVRNIVMIDPAGLMGQDSAFGLVKRTLENANEQSKIIKEKIQGNDPRQDQHPGIQKKPITLKIEGREAEKNDAAQFGAFVASFKSDPKKWLEGISAISGAQIGEALQFLRQEYGIKIGIIHGDQDLVFPAGEIEKSARGLFDIIHIIPETHAGFGQNPDNYAKLTKETLADLEKKHKIADLNKSLQSHTAQ